MLRLFVVPVWLLALSTWSRPGDGSPPWRARGEPGSVAGPSAMLEWQRRGARVFDARESGRFVAHTEKVTEKAGPRNVPQGEPILVIAETRERALKVSPRAVWVPARLLEIAPRAGVRQMPPRQAFERARRGEITLIDVSEAHEWKWERLPLGRRVDWMRIVGRDRSWLKGIDRKKPIVFACRLGGRSQIAAQTLAREGFATANLAGGVWAWQGCGLPVAGSNSSSKAGGGDG